MKLKDKSGISSLLLVLALAGLFMMLFVSMGNVFRSLNKSTHDLKENTASANALLDMAQIVSQGYLKAKLTSPPTPPGCDSTSKPYQVPSTSIYLCLPKDQYCSQMGLSYCIAEPPSLAEYKGSQDNEIYVVKKEATRSVLPSVLDLLIPQAHAVPPSPWLPDLDSMTPPTLRIAVPDCSSTTGNQSECIRCNAPNKNADCIKIRICTNRSNNCPSSADYIEPVFAMQTSYN